MVYGEEKARDMTRSLLPSRHRASARSARATIHRSARRQSRVELAQLARDVESYEDLAGLDDDVNGEIRRMVCGRRQGDKIAPFIRWARAITRPLPQHSRLSHLRGLVLPRRHRRPRAVPPLAQERLRAPRRDRAPGSPAATVGPEQQSPMDGAWRAGRVAACPPTRPRRAPRLQPLAPRYLRSPVSLRAPPPLLLLFARVHRRGDREHPRGPPPPRPSRSP